MFLLHAGFFAGASASFAQFRTTEKNQWELELYNLEGYTPNKTKSKEPTEQEVVGHKLCPMFDVFGGWEKRFGPYHFWSNSVGLGYTNPTIEEKNSEAVILNIQPIQYTSGEIQNDIPIRGNIKNPDIHSVKIKKFFINARSIIGVTMKSYHLGLGISAMTCPIEQHFYTENPKYDFNQTPFKKWGFGAGPCATVKYDILPNIRLTCYGEVLFFKSLKRDPFNFEENIDKKHKTVTKNFVTFKITPTIWRICLGVEWHPAYIKKHFNQKEIAQKVKYYKFVCKERNFVYKKNNQEKEKTTNAIVSNC